MNHAVFENGSTWLRADFHLHTRCDKEFKYEGPENSFVSDYVDALKESGIQVGIITNHNKFDLGEYRALRKRAEKEEIFLMPGVELSVGDGANGVHCLLVFANEWIEGGDHINSFLSNAFAGKVSATYEQENGRTEKNLLAILGMLEDWNKDFFVVFAHVEQDKGLWKELDGGRLQELGKNELFRRRSLAFQKVRTTDKRKIFQDHLSDAYPSEVEGCDCKSLDRLRQARDHQHKVFLKIGAPNFDALKYALIDHRHRVRSELPQIHHSYIQSMKFEGGLFSGQTVNFSSELNTLIGIRGSGKSSLLEALRYALDIPFGEKAADIRYKEDLIGHVLGSGGRVTVSAFDRHGQAYEIRRIYRERPEVFADGKLQPGISLRETVVHKPIYFGQKDLSNTGEGFERDLIDKLVGNKLSDIREKIESQRQQVALAIQSFKKAMSNVDLHGEYLDKKRDAEHRLNVYEKLGVEEKMERQDSFDKDLRRVLKAREVFSNYVQASLSVVSEYEDELRAQSAHVSKYNGVFFEQFFLAYQRALSALDQHQTAIRTANLASEAIETKVAEFQKLIADQKEEFAQIERRVSDELMAEGTTIRLEEYKQVKAALTKANAMLETLGDNNARRSAASAKLKEELSQLNELWLKEYQLIQAELARVNDGDSPLQISVEFKGDKTSALSHLKALFRGSKLREAALEKVVGEYADFGAVFDQLATAAQNLGSGASIFESKFQENLVELLTFQVPNQFTIKFHGKELKYHSLGQRASALMLFILAQQDNDVVIIDQPEDDLDNQTIYADVIKLVCQLKPKLQFIFATHNPNFPVLGDAEQVIACSYDDAKVRVSSGSIDDPEQQTNIVKIMEGGSEALSRRQRRYEAWNHQNS